MNFSDIKRIKREIKREIVFYIWLKKSKLKGILCWLYIRIFEDRIRLYYRKKTWSFKKQCKYGLLN